MDNRGENLRPVHVYFMESGGHVFLAVSTCVSVAINLGHMILTIIVPDEPDGQVDVYMQEVNQYGQVQDQIINWFEDDILYNIFMEHLLRDPFLRENIVQIIQGYEDDAARANANEASR